jgi:hypothetical protein
MQMSLEPSRWGNISDSIGNVFSNALENVVGSSRLQCGEPAVWFKPMLRWVTIDKFSAESGYTPDAVRSKIKRGDWLEGQVYIKAPDGRILIDKEGYEAWVTSQVCASEANRR